MRLESGEGFGKYVEKERSLHRRIEIDDDMESRRDLLLNNSLGRVFECLENPVFQQGYSIDYGYEVYDKDAFGVQIGRAQVGKDSGPVSEETKAKMIQLFDDHYKAGGVFVDINRIHSENPPEITFDDFEKIFDLEKINISDNNLWSFRVKIHDPQEGDAWYTYQGRASVMMRLLKEFDRETVTIKLYDLVYGTYNGYGRDLNNDMAFQNEDAPRIEK